MADLPERSDLRASDQDREKVVAILQEHFAQGRLDQEEFDERTTTAYQAKTFGELAPLTRDLPVGQQAAAPQERTEDRPWYRADWMRYSPWAIFGVIGLVFLVVTLVTGAHFTGWPFWIFVPWFFMVMGGGRSRRRYRYEQERRARDEIDRQHDALGRSDRDRGDRRDGRHG